MKDLSIVIPARNERWLNRTVEDLIAWHCSNCSTRLMVEAKPEKCPTCEVEGATFRRNIHAETEVIVVLDGVWPEEPLPRHDRLTVVFLPGAIGQRAATNLGVRLSSARYVMKLDAHCSVANGFDRALIDAAEELGPDVTQIPAQKNLHVYNNVCDACETTSDQAPHFDACPNCQGPLRKELVWKPRDGVTTTSWHFDSQPKFRYASNKGQRGDICDVMTSLGACFFMSRARFWQLGGLDEGHGSWGSLGIEVACKSWLSGGRHVVNRRTWFSHFFRVGGIGFPYHIAGRDQDRARDYARDLWFNNKWAGQVRPLSWLIDKFAPVPGWHDSVGSEILDSVTRQGLGFSNPGAVAYLAESMRASSGGAPVRSQTQPVPMRASGLAPISVADGAGDVNVGSVVDQLEVNGVAAPLDLALVVNDEPVDDAALAHRDWSNQPRVHEPVCQHVESATPTNVGMSVASGSSGCPYPAARIGDTNLSEDTGDDAAVDVGECEKLNGSHASASNAVVGSGSSPRVQRGAGPIETPNYPTKSIVYYSDCRADERVLTAARATIERAGLPIVAVTLKPIDWPAARNIVLPLERGYLTMFMQILAGLEAARSRYVFFCEHDVAYHPSHFEFTPPAEKRNTYFYNANVWRVDAVTGRALHYLCNQTSGLCANRSLLINHYRARVAAVRAYGYSRNNGFEPGTRHCGNGGYDDHPHEVWMSEAPNVDIRHGQNLTPSRWEKSQFRNQKYTAGWTEAEGVPSWGRTLGRFDAFLAEVVSASRHHVAA